MQQTHLDVLFSVDFLTLSAEISPYPASEWASCWSGVNHIPQFKARRHPCPGKVLPSYAYLSVSLLFTSFPPLSLILKAIPLQLCYPLYSWIFIWKEIVYLKTYIHFKFTQWYCTLNHVSCNFCYNFLFFCPCHIALWFIWFFAFNCRWLHTFCLSIVLWLLHCFSKSFHGKQLVLWWAFSFTPP